jgi:hypothetical protein
VADNIAVTAGSGTTVSTEEITTLNGGAVSAQHVQRVIVATRTADGTAIDANLGGLGYETVAASQTDQVMGASGATGDYLDSLLVVPATTSPGAISIKDGAGSAITVFTGGASSVATLHPFSIQLQLKSAAGAWKVTTGSNVSAVACGTFS